MRRQWLGNVLRDQSKYAAAASVYRKLILLEPDYGMARCELGFVLQKLGRRDQAIPAVSRGIGSEIEGIR